MYLFFDTETNGLPTKGESIVDRYPRVIQLAYIAYDRDFNETERFCALIKPDGWTIPTEKFWIDNGYSTENNEKYGIPMQNGLYNFITMMRRSQYLVAHNMDFDNPTLGAEMLRYDIRPYNKPEKICTMKTQVQFVGALNKIGKPKWPRLDELHMKLFGVCFENAHDALADVEATARCFRELRKRNLI